MATWMTHFRIASHFLGVGKDLSAREFLVGTIGPDCGEPNESWTAFTPVREVSHWFTDGGVSRDEEFYRAFLLGRERQPQGPVSFYLGYYVHLLTDIEWGKRLYHPKKALFEAEFRENEEFIWQFKRDWYDLDHLFLRENPGFQAFADFSSIKGFANEYLDYYSPTAFQRQIDYISGFYHGFSGDLDHEYPYLSKEEMDGFVAGCTESIAEVLERRGWS